MQGTKENRSIGQLYRALITGSHILHYHDILDAYGHLSFRHPADPAVFIMSRFIAPGTVRSPRDLVHYHVSTAEPVDPESPKGYAERHIHSELYKRHAGIQSVVHSHAESVVPYSISGVPLRPCYHMAGFLGSQVPVFDISRFWRDGDVPDMLVRNAHLGAALAASFGPPDAPAKHPRHAVVLMRGHGFTAVGDCIEECVLRAVYTAKNASVQTTVLTTRAATEQAGEQGTAVDPVRYLDEKECEATAQMTKWSKMRPWGLWEREVEASPLYVNEA